MDEAQIAGYVDAFARDGFVHAKSVVPRDEIARFRDAVDKAVAARKINDTRAFEEKTLYEQSFIQCQNLWEDWPDVRALTFHPAIAALATRLIGAKRLRLWHDQALYKEPGGRDTDAHQDHPYWPIAEDLTLTAWIPLIDVTDKNGCMGYVPGSHRGHREFINIFTEPGSGEKLLSRLAPTTAVFVPARAGDVLFHHGYTAHLAKPNASSVMRPVHTAIYFADGCTRGASPKHHPSVDRAKIAVGNAIASDVTPIAWPLENGLPKPVPWPDSERLRGLKRLGIVPDQVQ
jgi:ectoine hydroxylase-related dioxygenase (phytanoyl-CoA dioxygenase family)